MDIEFNLDDILSAASNSDNYDVNTPRSQRASKTVVVSDELISFEEDEGYDD